MLDLLIKYFVYQTKGHITKTQLVKFLYLADLYSVKWTGKQLTELDWYLHGPWHENIDAVLDKMDGKEILQEPQRDAVLIKLGPKAGNVEELKLPVSLKLILENIKREWAGAGQDRIQQLLDYVYSTAPMLEVKEVHKPEEKVRLNLQKERERLIQELD